jgi:choline dehydrogenase-like flavoprotein
MVFRTKRAVAGGGVKRKVTANPTVFAETHFGLTAPTTISGISTCSRSEKTGRSGAVSSTASCRGWAFALGSFKGGQIGQLEETPGLSAGAWQMRPLSRGYVEAKSNRPGDMPAINPRYLSGESDRRAIVGSLRVCAADVRRLGAKAVRPGRDPARRANPE